MQHLLVTCLLFTTFIASGASLSCEICAGFGHTCEGPLQTCPLGFDTCGILQTQSTRGLQASVFQKTCLLGSSDCDKDPFIMNLGNFGTSMTKHTCCPGNDCSKAPPPMPPINTQPNGKTCPASYCLHSSECKEEVAQCAGDESYCFALSGTATLGEMTVTLNMKGCTNAAACNETSHSSGSFGGISIIQSFGCTHALANGTASSIPEFIRLSFQVLAGVLLMKMLS